MKKILIVLMLMFCSLSFGWMLVNAAEITLAWDPSTSTNITGYRLFGSVYGDPFDYSTPLYEGVATSATVVVPDNTEYQFVVRAYLSGDSGKVYESGDSNQVNHAVIIWQNPNLRIE